MRSSRPGRKKVGENKPFGIVLPKKADNFLGIACERTLIFSPSSKINRSYRATYIISVAPYVVSCVIDKRPCHCCSRNPCSVASDFEIRPDSSIPTLDEHKNSTIDDGSELSRLFNLQMGCRIRDEQAAIGFAEALKSLERSMRLIQEPYHPKFTRSSVFLMAMSN